MKHRFSHLFYKRPLIIRFLWWFVVRLLQTAYEELNRKYSLLQRSERDPGQAWDPKPHSCTPCMPKPSKSCAHLRYTEVKPDKVVPIRLHNFVAYERCFVANMSLCFSSKNEDVSSPQAHSLSWLVIYIPVHFFVVWEVHIITLYSVVSLYLLSVAISVFDQFMPAFTID